MQTSSLQKIRLVVETMNFVHIVKHIVDLLVAQFNKDYNFRTGGECWELWFCLCWLLNEDWRGNAKETGMQEVEKKTFWGDIVIGRTHVRTKRLNEKLIEIQKKRG